MVFMVIKVYEFLFDIYFVILIGICEAWHPKDSTKIDGPGSSELTCYVSFDQRFVSSTGNIVV